ncbi:MAG: hypothetical protein HOP11_07815 [Saprospiraceae bacterium]|nr:hypothetical protein [Saprospiraceae bacterium]
MRFEERFDFTIEVDKEIDIQEVKIPTMMIQPIVENSVRHGLFHRKEGGFLSVKLMKVNKDLLIEITDNGIGIEKSHSMKDSASNAHQSHATKIIKEKIEIINKGSKDEIFVDTQESNPIDPNFKGTCTRITLSNLLED